VSQGIVSLLPERESVPADAGPVGVLLEDALAAALVVAEWGAAEVQPARRIATPMSAAVEARARTGRVRRAVDMEPILTCFPREVV
jgi:hypothetical protein